MKFQRRQFLQLAAGAAALPLTSGNASAQAYPSRPVRLVIGYTQGGNARLSFRITVMAHQTNLVTFVLIVRIPTEGIKDFRAYEDAVLPLLPEFNGRLERRLRNPEGTIEMHIVSFASDADFQNYRNDPRRTAQAWLLEKSSAKLELLPMANVS